MSAQRDEIAEKARFWNSGTVNARLTQWFEDADRRSASVLIAGLVGDVPGGAECDSDEASCRLMLDAIKVSEGSLQKLAMWVEVARMDPRDLIAAAEYRRELATLDADEADDVREDDLLEYLLWVSGGPQR